MSDENIRRILRNQAWFRAKGELAGILTTFQGEQEQFEKLREAAEEFINKVEKEGLAE